MPCHCVILHFCGTNLLSVNQLVLCRIIGVPNQQLERLLGPSSGSCHCA